MASEDQVTQLLVEWKNGNKDALDLLTPLIYDELRRLADRYLRLESDAATLQPTALVHEAYIRLIGDRLPDWQSRAHFFGIAARRMRQILVEHARRHHAAKRGSGVKPVAFEEALNFAPERGGEVVALDDALTALAAFDQRKARVIELRFFGGLGPEEVAEAIGVSVSTVAREQRLAEAWLHREMTSGR